MTVLGLDPGTATVGYAVVKGIKTKPEILSFGVIKTLSTTAMNERLCEIGEDLEQILTLYKPDVAVIEDLFYFKNQKTVISVAQARGVMMYLTCKHGLELKELTPLQVKQALTGYGRAPKKQIQTIIQKIYKLDELPTPDDAADALGIAWCGLR